MSRRRVREVAWETPSPDYFLEKARHGWTLVALEWERDEENAEPGDAGLPADVPYGLRIASTSHALEEDPDERTVLGEMLALIVKEDVPFSLVARALNQKGFRTRSKTAWTPAEVFDMLPRLIEVAPTILTSDEWTMLKSRV